MSDNMIDPYYSNGEYFSDSEKYSEDAKSKSESFIKLFKRFQRENRIQIKTLVDVGCGSGETLRRISDSLRKTSSEPMEFKGYDVSPHVSKIQNDGIEFVFGDFSESNENVDIVTLFDVIEHVVDPIEFIKSIASRCKIVAFHIPLDNSLNIALRDKFQTKLSVARHILFLDTASALNLLSFSGLRVVAYEYNLSFLSPSGHKSIKSKLLLPVRYLIGVVSPWLLSKSLGGVSLMVFALTQRGLHELEHKD